jgi:hypothetical protein
VKLLQGVGLGEDMKLTAQSLGLKVDNYLSLLDSAGAILWEFVKGSPSDPTLVSISLQHVGVPVDLAEQFANV